MKPPTLEQLRAGMAPAVTETRSVHAELLASARDLMTIARDMRAEYKRGTAAALEGIAERLRKLATP